MDQFQEIQGNFHEDFTTKLNLHDSDDTVHDQEHQEDVDLSDDDDFSFVINGDDTTPIPADAIFFPLFDQDLLSDNDSDVSEDRVPRRPMKVFAEIGSSDLPSSSLGSDEIEGIAEGPYCVWTKKGKDKKSNSTGVSKLWRFKDFVNRSNSDGRDAFVFLNSSTATKKVEKLPEKSTVEKSSVKKSMVSEASMDKMLGGNEKVKKAGKGKTATLSGYEIYIKNKGLQEDRKRSYLPYKPELFGFFTNVHGGLSRNIHPY